MSYIYDYPRPAVGCEIVLFDLHSIEVPQVLLVKRGNDPWKGMWSIPGGFMEIDEELEDCALRELWEETAVSLEQNQLQQLFTKGKISRDPRGRIIVVVYGAVIDRSEHILCAGDDAEEVAWFRMDDMPSLASDHLETIRETLGEFYHDTI